MKFLVVVTPPSIYHTPKKGFQKKQENHTIIENMMDELHMVKPKKVSAVNHKAPEFLGIEYNKNDLYQVENICLDETKEKIEQRKRAIE